MVIVDLLSEEQGAFRLLQALRAIDHARDLPVLGVLPAEPSADDIAELRKGFAVAAEGASSTPEVLQESLDRLRTTVLSPKTVLKTIQRLRDG
jgi:hypothetical protein